MRSRCRLSASTARTAAASVIAKTDGSAIRSGAHLPITEGTPMPPPRPFLFCLVPEPLAARLLEPLQACFAEDPTVEVLVERRSADRPVPSGHSRAPVAARDLPARLPPELRELAKEVAFVQRMEPLGPVHAYVPDDDLVRLVRDGDPAAASELWWRYRERVRIVLRSALARTDADGAERSALGAILDALDFAGPDGEQAFGEWLDDVVRAHAGAVGPAAAADSR